MFDEQFFQPASLIVENISHFWINARKNMRKKLCAGTCLQFRA
jgi:hypothetical protein